jgi:hypothetical protein
VGRALSGGNPVIQAVLVLLLATGCTRYVDLGRGGGDAGSAKPDGGFLPDALDTGDAGQSGVDAGVGIVAPPHD